MGVYDRQIASAKRMIAKYGETVSWKVKVESDQPSDTPWHSNPPTEIEHSPKIAFFPNTGSFAKAMQMMTGKEYSVGNVLGYMPAVDFKPDMTGEVIRKDGRKLEIKSIDEICPNGEVVLYTIEFYQ